MLQIYPFLSTISLQSLAGFPIFEKLGYSLDRRQAVPGQRTSPPPHTSRFLPPPTFVGRHVGPSLFSPRARGARLLRQGVPGHAVAFGPSAALGIATRCARGCSSARTAAFSSARSPARCKATSPRTPQPPGGGEHSPALGSRGTGRRCRRPGPAPAPGGPRRWSGRRRRPRGSRAAAGRAPTLINRLGRAGPASQPAPGEAASSTPTPGSPSFLSPSLPAPLTERPPPSPSGPSWVEAVGWSSGSQTPLARRLNVEEMGFLKVQELDAIPRCSDIHRLEWKVHCQSTSCFFNDFLSHFHGEGCLLYLFGDKINHVGFLENGRFVISQSRPETGGESRRVGKNGVILLFGEPLLNVYMLKPCDGDTKMKKTQGQHSKSHNTL
nr:uncharacterized protein LOC110146790 [Odocoileus virginianus texanus]